MIHFKGITTSVKVIIKATHESGGTDDGTQSDTVFVCKKLKAMQMERVGDWIRVGSKSNMMRVLIRRGRFGHRDIDTWGEDGLGG